VNNFQFHRPSTIAEAVSLLAPGNDSK